MRRLSLAANQSRTSPIVAVAGSAENRSWMTSATVKPAASSILVLAMGTRYCCGREMLVGEREEGAPGGRDAIPVPGERGAALEPWASDRDDGDGASFCR